MQVLAQNALCASRILFVDIRLFKMGPKGLKKDV